MKLIPLLLLLQLNPQIGLAQIDTLKTIFERNEYFNISELSNEKVLIYMHGGLSNPHFQEGNDITLQFLLEDNNDFIANATKNNFDVIIPITNDSLNWLSKNTFCFNAFKKYIESLDKDYEEIWISGFSDGGTGSFKMFYTNHQYFKGLIVFNGYPFHENFAENVNYKAVTNKKILFFATKNDKRVPYEFLLTEYAKQKKSNPNTYFYLTNGKHLFNSYEYKDFELLFKILLEVNNEEGKPIHGLVLNDQLIEFYKYRKSIIRKYHFGNEDYIENKKQKREIKTLANRVDGPISDN